MPSLFARRPAGNARKPSIPPDADNTEPIETSGPQFGEPVASPDPTKFVVKHASDKEAYTILDREKGSLKPRPFPIAEAAEPTLTLAEAIGEEGASVEAAITKTGQIVFHAVGDTGNTRGPKDEDEVADKMVSDFDETNTAGVPSFCYHLGDVVYSFGEAEYYYDQFYDPYRNYPAPIFAIAGNHDGMVAPYSTTPTLQAFLDNFCTAGQEPHRTPEAGGLARTAGIQPAIYFTLEAPFVRLLGLYSNCLEDPGMISSQKGAKETYPYLPDAQLSFLETALKRVKKEKFAGAVLIAVHHPPYVAVTGTAKAAKSAGKHIGSPFMLADIDTICAATGVWPHAVLSGHAHNYQRFTRRLDGRETPFVIMGNSGHAHNSLTKKGEPALRTPVLQGPLSNGKDEITFENYDDQDFGYLRIIVNQTQLHIEYHPASDGPNAKTADDFVTVDLKSQTLTPYRPTQE
jgi:Calcineurin-like phosphoesterase/Iron/zinc purple acid phosphatase-like protein C